MHLTDTEIHQYIEDPTDEAVAHVPLHIATCSECRHKVLGLQRVKEQLERKPQWLAYATDNSVLNVSEGIPLSRQLLGVEGGAKLAEIKKDPQKLKAALHTLSHESAMERGLKIAGQDQVAAAASQASVDNSPRLTLWQKVWSALVTPQPIWMNAVATSFLVISVLLLMPSLEMDSDGLVQYQDQPGLEIVQKQMPQVGVGFFSNAQAVRQDYAGVSVHRLDETLFEFSWPEVAGVDSYQLAIYQVNGAEQKLLKSTIADTTQTQIPLTGINTQQRYEWVLSGEIGPEKSFKAKGGFILNAAHP